MKSVFEQGQVIFLELSRFKEIKLSGEHNWTNLKLWNKPRVWHSRPCLRHWFPGTAALQAPRICLQSSLSSAHSGLQLSVFFVPLASVTVLWFTISCSFLKSQVRYHLCLEAFFWTPPFKSWAYYSVIWNAISSWRGHSYKILIYLLSFLVILYFVN